MPVTLTSISPSSGPPGTVVTLTGAGFDASSQAACPTLQPTTLVSATQLTAAIPADLAGAAGSSMAVGVFVVGGDGSTSAVCMFTVEFPASQLQTWTTIDAVTGEVPGFMRGGQISDDQIQTWMSSIAQAIAGVMLRRGLPLDPTQWAQPAADAWPTPAGVLELINRMGAAARLAAAVASLSGAIDWPIRKNLQTAFDDEIATLLGGDYDKLFLPSAATLEAGQQFGGQPGWPKFRKEKVF